MRVLISCVLAATLGLGATEASAERLKELITIEGFRTNKLTGFGIVVGLGGTGDDASSPLIRKSLAKMLKRLGITVPAAEIKAKNVAAVIVTAELPPFARAGASLDVTVSSVGSAKNLSGGTLLSTPLKAANLQTFAIAAGPLSTGGFAVSGASGSSQRKNHVTVGRIPGGATIEASAPARLPKSKIVMMLRSPDFTTAARIADAVNRQLGDGTARVRDPGAVEVLIGAAWRGRAVHLIAALESIEATPDSPARVIIDERTGTVVVGEHVRLGRAAIAHGAITIEISESVAASQPNPLSKGGETVVTPETEVKVAEAVGDLQKVEGATTVGDVASALNALGAKPRDLVSIFQALEKAGALRAQIVIL